jgi:hypothetical protein
MERQTSGYQLVEPNEHPVVRDSFASQVLFPAIAVPIQTKQVFECPKRHIDELTARLPRTTHLLVIGWRDMDQHFIRLLRDHLAGRRVRVQLVCGAKPEETQEIQQNLLAAGLDADYGEDTPRTFTDYMLKKAGAEFLAASAHGG